MIVSRQRIMLAVASTCLAAATLAGCGQASDFDSGVAASLQAATEKVRTDAAAGRYAEALDELANIESQADDAAADGKLSPARKQDVLAALALVRTDLQALMGSRSTPSASPTTASETPSSTPLPKPKKKDRAQDAPAPDQPNS